MHSTESNARGQDADPVGNHQQNHQREDGAGAQPNQPTITLGRRLDRPKGRRVVLSADDPVADLVRVLEKHAGREALISLGTFVEDYVEKDRWRSSCAVGVDVDYYDAVGEHAALPDALREQIDDLLVAASKHDGDEAGPPGNLSYRTPRGARIIFVLDQVVTDRDRWRRAAKGAVELTRHWLQAIGYAAPEGTCVSTGKPGPVDGLHVDVKASTDRARRWFAPRATVGGIQRGGQVRIMALGPIAIEALIAMAPRETDESHDQDDGGPRDETLRATYERILSQLKEVRRRSGDDATARCPAHDDRDPSLSVRIVKDRILLHCHTGCRVDAVVAELGVTMADLFTSAHVPPGEGWPEPIPLDSAPLPPFPVDALPRWLAEWTTAVAVATQTPPDLAGMLGLAAIATGAARRIAIELRPGWSEPANLYVLTALGVGERKTPVYKCAMEPVYAVETDLARERAPEITVAQTRRRVLEMQHHKAVEAAAKCRGDDDPAVLMAEAESLALRLAEERVPVLPRLVAADATPEAVGTLLAEHDGRIAILSDEAAILEILGGRYSDHPAIETFLQAHAGSPILVDRKGRPPERVDKPAITLGLTVQPDVIRGLAAKPDFRGRGLLARILYAVPRSLVGSRQVDAPPVPDAIAEEYRARLTAILSAPLARGEDGTIIPSVLAYDPAGSELSKAYEAEVEHAMAQGGRLRAIADWATKLVGHVARIAGCLALAEDPDAAEIGAGTVARAIRIGRYLTDHALEAFGEMSADPAIEDARRMWGWIGTKGLSVVSRRDLHRGCMSHGRAEDLDPGIRVLVERGYLRPRRSDRSDSRTYDVWSPPTADASSSTTDSSPPDHEARKTDDAADNAHNCSESQDMYRQTSSGHSTDAANSRLKHEASPTRGDEPASSRVSSVDECQQGNGHTFPRETPRKSSSVSSVSAFRGSGDDCGVLDRVERGEDDEDGGPRLTVGLFSLSPDQRDQVGRTSRRRTRSGRARGRPV